MRFHGVPHSEMGLQPEPDSTPSFTVPALRASRLPSVLLTAQSANLGCFSFCFRGFWAPSCWVFLYKESLLSLVKEHKDLLPEQLQIAMLTRYLMAMKYLFALVVSEDLRLQTAQLLIWKRQKLLSEDKMLQSKWVEKTLLGCPAQERYSWFRSQHPRQRGRRPEGQQPGHKPHRPDCETYLGGTETTGTPRLPTKGHLCLGREHGDKNDRLLLVHIWKHDTYLFRSRGWLLHFKQ